MLCQSASLAWNFTFLASNFSLWKTNNNAFPGFVCVPFFLCRCRRLGRVTTNAISWSVDFIVFQCYWRAAMRNIPLPSIKQELLVKSGGDGSVGSKFTAISFLRLIRCQKKYLWVLRSKLPLSFGKLAGLCDWSRWKISVRFASLFTTFKGCSLARRRSVYFSNFPYICL